MMIVLVVSHVLYLVFVRVESYDVISSLSPKNCNDSSYFDSLSHKCKSCGIFQTASRDRLSCKCDVGRYPGYSEKTKSIECVSCVQSFQSDTCLKDNINCELYDIKGRNHSFIFYLSIFLLFFYFYLFLFFYCVFYDGVEWLNYYFLVLQVIGNTTIARCLRCPLWHQPDASRLSCIPCSDKCHCPGDYEDVNGTCVKDYFSFPDTPSIFAHNLDGRTYTSNYLREWVRPAAAKCKVPYH